MLGTGTAVTLFFGLPSIKLTFSANAPEAASNKPAPTVSPVRREVRDGRVFMVTPGCWKKREQVRDKDSGQGFGTKMRPNTHVGDRMTNLKPQLAGYKKFLWLHPQSVFHKRFESPYTGISLVATSRQRKTRHYHGML